MDARGFYGVIILITLLVAVTLTSSEDSAQNPRTSSTTHQLDSEEEEKEQRLFLLKLFEKYGDNGQMSFEGFEHLFESIGLGNVQIGDHDVHDHHTEHGFREFHSDHEHNDSMKGKSAAEGEKENRMEAQQLEDAAAGDETRLVKSVEKKRKRERGGRKNGTERPDGEIEGRQKRSSVLFVEQKVSLLSLNMRQISLIPDEGKTPATMTIEQVRTDADKGQLRLDNGR